MITFFYLLLQAFAKKLPSLKIVILCALIDTFGIVWVIRKIEYIIELLSVLL